MREKICSNPRKAEDSEVAIKWLIALGLEITPDDLAACPFAVPFQLSGLIKAHSRSVSVKVKEKND